MTSEHETLGITSTSRRTFLGGGIALVGAGMASPLLAGCGSSGSEGSGGSGKRSVSVRFNWTIKGEYSPFFVAREKGYYDEEGITVKLAEGKSGTQAVQVVGTGHDDFGYIPSIQVVEGINKGVPIKTVATTGRYTGMCWASWPDVPLTSPESLLGHRVTISPSSTFAQVWPALQESFDLDVSKIDIVHPDPSARVALFLRHKIDIMADIFYANDLVILQTKADKKLNSLRLSEFDFDPLGYLFVVRNDLLNDDPDLVRRMVRATLKGFRYTIDHPMEAAKIMNKLWGDRFEKGVLAGQIKNMLDLLIRDPGVGQATDAMWNPVTRVTEQVRSHR